VIVTARPSAPAWHRAQSLLSALLAAIVHIVELAPWESVRTFMRVLHLGQSGASVSRRDLRFSFDTIGGALETWSESRSASSATERRNASTLTG
jgi:hypothetical protein